ncbi:MAG: hypothetical protein ABFS34_02795 [Gemmatimonadota bacterium]
MTEFMRTWRLAALAGLAVAVAACSETATDVITPIDGPTPQLAEIDLSNTAGDSIVVNDALWTFPVPFNVGTGLINPFLSVQNNPNEEGFNTDDSPLPLDDTRPNFTNALPLNFVPIIESSVGLAREIILDANESNSEPDALFSIDRFDLWMCDDAGAPAYDDRSDFQSNASCELVYDIDDDIGGSDVDHIKATDAVTSGSGLDLDYQILIPEANFLAAAAAIPADISGCAFQGIDATPCGIFLVLDVRMGFQGGDLTTGATFEEMSTIKRPFVEVTKTADPSLDRDHMWEIVKSVDIDQHDLFTGDSAKSKYTVEVNWLGSVDSNWAVSGNIVIKNPSDSDVGVEGVADTITPGDIPVTPVCGVTFPVTVAAGDSLVCTYTASLPDGTNRTNTAFVDLVDVGVGMGSTAIDFASATITEMDDSVNITDSFEGPLGSAVADTAMFMYDRWFVCDGDEGMHENVAEIIETMQADTANVTVNCGNVTVTKTATANLEEDFQWDITKSHSDADSTLNLFKGDDGDVKYTLNVTKMSASQVHSVAGEIVIVNTATIDKTAVDVIDCVQGSDDGGTSWMDLACDTVAMGITISAEDTDTLDYDIEFDPTGKTSFQNVVDIEMGGMVIDSDTAGFALATMDDDPGNDEVTIEDDFSEFLENGDTISSDTMFMYTVNFACDADEGMHPNTAAILSFSGDTVASDDELMEVVCHDLTVSKTVDTDFKRRYDWDVDKELLTDMLVNFVNDTATVVPGQILTPKFEFTVDTTGVEDFGFFVSGDIKVVNPNPDLPATVDVSDELSDMMGLTVDCGDGDGLDETIAAGDSISCAYSDSLSGDFDGTNKATAELENNSFDKDGVPTPSGTTTFMSSAETVDFGDPSMIIDECVDVEDIFQDVNAMTADTTDLGRFCVEQGDEPDASDVVALPHTFPASPHEVVIQLDDTRCGVNEFTNTVTATEIDNSTQHTDTELFWVNVVCEEGCTLTQGYWKTHNDWFWGGASNKADSTWFEIGDVDGDMASEGHAEDFFLSGTSWFGAMWTAPKGNMYWQLARQWIAATLNDFNAATTPEVDDALAAGYVFFSTYTPAQAKALPKQDPGTPGVIDSRAEIVAAMSLLTDYNEGLIGPGHCTEDDESAN